LWKKGYNGIDIGNSEQVIVADSYGTECKLSFYEKIGNNWICSIQTSGVVGKNGVSSESFEGDYCTPCGKYSLGFAFGTKRLSDIKTEYRQITNNSYWVDDPESSFYNQWVESQDKLHWNSAEHLIDYQQAYKYGVVIEYNMSPVIPYKGSAIFLHCMTSSYTAGCVAIP